MNKTKKTNILFLILTSTLLLFAGCTKIPDCSEKDTQYEKYKLNEETTTCELYKEIEKNSCGNGIAEENNDETSCNCPEDVPSSHPVLGCEGTYGDYLEKACTEQKTCELQENKKVTNQVKAVDLKNTDLTFRANFGVNVPFILDTIEDNKISVNLDYFKGPTSSSIKLRDIVLKEMILKNGVGIVLGTQNYGEQITTIGQKAQTKYFKLAETTEYEKKESIKVELIVSYTKDTYNSKGEISKTEEKIETLKVAIGSWTIINPNFDVE
jgi:hypothetical protein